MIPFEPKTCVLWRPDRPNHAVSGTLTFDQDHGLSADVIGSLDPTEPLVRMMATPPDGESDRCDLPDEVLPGGEEPIDGPDDPGSLVPLLFGIVPGLHVTLIDVHRTEGSNSVPGHAHEILSPTVLLLGAELPDGMDTLVSSIGMTFDVLGDWYDSGLGNFLPNVSEDDDGSTMRWTPPPRTEAALPNGDVIALSAPTARHRGARDFSIEARPCWSVQFGTAVSLRDAIGSVAPLRWLMSLVTRTPARLTQLRAVKADIRRTAFDVVFRAPEPRGDRRRIHPYAMALKPSDFDLAICVPLWIAATERLHVPMSLFFANWFADGLYGENRVLNAVGAAEALASRIYPYDRTELAERPEAVDQFVQAFPKGEQQLLRQRLKHINDPSLRSRLRRLAHDAGDAFSSVIADTNRWVSMAVDARNDIAHGSELSGRGGWLHALAVSVEHLVEIHLLMQLGLSADAAAHAMRDTPRTEWIAGLATEYLGIGAAHS